MRGRAARVGALSAQLPPGVEAIITTAVAAGVDLVLGALPDPARALLDPEAVRSRLERWALALVADVLAPPVRVTARDGATVTITVE